MAGLFDFGFGSGDFGGAGILPPWLRQPMGGNPAMGGQLPFATSPVMSGQFPPQYPTGSPVAAPDNAPIAQGDAQQPPPAMQAPAGPSGALAGNAASPGFWGGLGNYINNNPLTLMALGGGIAQHGVGGFAAAAPVAAHEQAQQRAQQSQGSTYQALRQAGVPHGQAIAAALNPDVLKTISAAHFETKPTWGVVAEKPDGTKSYGWIQPGSKTVDVPNIAGSVGDATSGLNSGLTGPALLETLPTSIANEVKAYVEGRSIPVGNARSPRVQYIKQLAAQYEPGFDETVFRGRNAGAQDWSSGKSSEMVRAANQTIHHVGNLIDSMDKLGNRQIPAWNYIANTAATATGSGAVTEFLPNAHAVAEEMSKVFKGANLSDAEIKQWEQSLGPNMSPEQQRAAVGKLSDLLHGSLQALEDKRLRSVGPARAEALGPLLNSDSQKTLEKISGWIKGTGAPKASPGSTGSSGGWSTLPGGARIREIK